MKSKTLTTKDELFSRLAEANMKKDYGKLSKTCDEFLVFDDPSITDDVRAAIRDIKAGCEVKDDEAIMKAFAMIVAIDGESDGDKHNTQYYISKISKALRLRDKNTAMKYSKEFSEKTSEALKYVKKDPLPPNFLYDLVRANQNGEARRVQKLMKKLPK